VRICNEIDYTNMIKALISFAFLLSVTCFGQEVECQYALTEDFTGVCESFYANGNIRSQTDFLNGIRHGNHREFYKDGQLSASATFDMEYYAGKIYRYSLDSIVIFEMELDSMETGKFIHYSKNGKNILATGQFKESYRDGKWTFYNELGDLMKISSYNSDETQREIDEVLAANGVYIIPYDETIDKLFQEEYGMPVEISPETVIDFPDTPAKFSDGNGELQDFINKTINYPVVAIENNLEGKVFLSFVVELNGSVTNVIVERGVCQSLDNEAKRVIKSMPNWNPGTYNRQKVRTRCRIPIVFTITDTDK
jgi:TonB family protein